MGTFKGEINGKRVIIGHTNQIELLKLYSDVFKYITVIIHTNKKNQIYFRVKAKRTPASNYKRTKALSRRAISIGKKFNLCINNPKTIISSRGLVAWGAVGYSGREYNIYGLYDRFRLMVFY